MTDSGTKEQFETGAVRDTQAGKLRYELIPLLPLKRLAQCYTDGSKRYSDDNWAKGMPFRRTYASMLRHLFAWAGGDRTEDNLASLVFGAFALMYYEDAILKGRLPRALDDMGVLPVPETGDSKPAEGA